MEVRGRLGQVLGMRNVRSEVPDRSNFACLEEGCKQWTLNQIKTCQTWSILWFIKYISKELKKFILCIINAFTSFILIILVVIDFIKINHVFFQRKHFFIILPSMEIWIINFFHFFLLCFRTKWNFWSIFLLCNCRTHFRKYNIYFLKFIFNLNVLLN